MRSEASFDGGGGGRRGAAGAPDWQEVDADGLLPPPDYPPVDRDLRKERDTAPIFLTVICT